MASTHRDFHITPAAGGHLLVDFSSPVIGLENYLIKRDWRRVADAEVRSEGCDYFWGNPNNPITDQPFPFHAPNMPIGTNPDTEEDIVLVHLARRPNGDHSIIVGTETRLWRFFSLEDGTYVLGDGAGDYVWGDPAGPYFEAIAGEWILIGSGFTTWANGARRWEAVNLNGYTILNNGKDLPQIYRLEWAEVIPFYELRELGVASVGTIAEFQTMLMLGDIVQIQDDAHTALMSMTDSGATTAAQVGSTFSSPITASIGAGTHALTVSVPAYFVPGDAGRWILLTNGYHAQIDFIVNPQTAFMMKPARSNATNLLFWMIDDPADYTVTSSAPIFTLAMEGLEILWDTGEVRRIDTYVNPTTVIVSHHLPIAAGTFSIENPNSYDTYTGGAVDEYQWRVLWSLPDEPLRLGPIYKGTMVAGTTKLVLDWPAKGLTSGQAILVAGAGAGQGNLLATIQSIAAHRVLMLNTVALYSVTSANVMAQDTVNSILGYYDLQDDGSGILRMMQLRNTLVVYKDTSIFTGIYTGDVDAPFAFEKIPGSHNWTLHYRWTLVDLHGQGHLYAGRNTFFTFDLTTRRAQIFKPLDDCSKLFYNGETELADSNEVWAADNTITKEIYLKPVASGQDKLIRLDYDQITVSTSSLDITSAATVKRPKSELSTGETADWFVMGNAESTILIYGRVDDPVTFWGTASAIFYRRFANPYSDTKTAYESRLKSGYGHFGLPHGEKHMRSHVPLLDAETTDADMTVNIYGGRNPTEVVLKQTYTSDELRTENLIAMHLLEILFGDEIICSTVDQEARVYGRIFEMAPVSSKSFVRRPV